MHIINTVYVAGKIRGIHAKKHVEKSGVEHSLTCGPIYFSHGHDEVNERDYWMTYARLLGR
jgi:hypothetical protein